MGPRKRLSSLLTLFRSEAYFAVGQSPRFQADLRRQAFDAARAAMLVVVGVAAFDLFAFTAIHPADVRLIIALNVTLAVVAILGRVLLDGRGPHAAEPVAFFVSYAVVVSCLLLGILGPDLAVLAAGYLLLIPPTVALIIVWKTWTHTIWLLAYATAAFAFIALAPEPSLTAIQRTDIAVLAMISILTSFAGHVLSIRVRIRGFVDLTDIRALRHEAETERRASEQAHAALELTSRQDQLTGTGNRLRLHEDLRSERGRIGRTGSPCGMLEADLDHFKGVNDHLGHLVGDRVLREVATVLQDASRAGDTVYRWGGEEFLVLLPGADTDDTTAAAERLRWAVEAASLPHPANDPRGVVTVSIGGTVIHKANLKETDEVWIGRADRALYQAKADGRNRVSFELPDRLDGPGKVVA